MAKSPRRIGLRSIMVAVVVMAVSFSCLGVPGGSVAMVIFGIWYALLGPIEPDRRLGAWVWVFSIHPTLLLGCLYLTWGVAWVLLGHEPRPTGEEPYRLGPVIAGIAVVTRMMQVGVAISLLGSVILSTIESKRRYLLGEKRQAVILPFLGPVVWAIAFVFLQLDPFWVKRWFLA